MNILIVYGTTDGQTGKIAHFIEEILRREGHMVICTSAADSPPAPYGFDAVLIGASMHIQKYQPAVRDYIVRFRETLNLQSSAFFAVCLSMISQFEEDRAESKKIMNDFLAETRWKPTMAVQIAGALMYTKYNFLIRFVMKRIAKKEGRDTDTSHDYEYTDWNAVQVFVHEFIAKAEAQNRLPVMHGDPLHEML